MISLTGFLWISFPSSHRWVSLFLGSTTPLTPNFPPSAVVHLQCQLFSSESFALKSRNYSVSDAEWEFNSARRGELGHSCDVEHIYFQSSSKAVGMPSVICQCASKLGLQFLQGVSCWHWKHSWMTMSQKNSADSSAVGFAAPPGHQWGSHPHCAVCRIPLWGTVRSSWEWNWAKLDKHCISEPFIGNEKTK